MNFLQTVKVNDVVVVYVLLDGDDGVKRVGNTSMDIEVWLRRGSYWCVKNHRSDVYFCCDR